MRFSERLRQSTVPEWIDYYVDYKSLKVVISPFKLIGKSLIKAKLEVDGFELRNTTEDDQEKLEKFAEYFENLIYHEMKKIFAFYSTKLAISLGKWRKYKLNQIIVKDHHNLPDEVQGKHKMMLKAAFHLIHKEFKMLQTYLSLNIEAFSKLLKKNQKHIQPLLPNSRIEENVSKTMKYFKAYKIKDRLTNFTSHIENDYIDFFFQNRKDGLKELRNVISGKLISSSQLFFLATFFGCSTLMFIIILIVVSELDLSPDDHEEFKNVFPVFRGISMLICYIWVLGWNCYTWTKYNVNYKLIFKFDYHYSEVFQILNRAALFTVLHLFMFIWMLALLGPNSSIKEVIDFFPIPVTPFLVWAIFFLYLFFPSKKNFNYRGRYYIWKVMKKTVKSPVIGVNFLTTWITSQILSFMILFRDFQYGICYYIDYLFGNDDPENCANIKGFNLAIFFGLVVAILKCLQKVRMIYDNALNRNMLTLDSIKYVMLIILLFLDMGLGTNEDSTSQLVAYIVFAVITSCYFTFWDIFYEWGFLQKKAKFRFLRSEIAIEKPGLYYTVMALNIVLRSVWVISISTNLIFLKFDNPEVAAMLFALGELLRLALWNLISVEKEHILNVGSLKAVRRLKFPYPDIEFNEKVQEDYLFHDEIANLLEKDNNQSWGLTPKESQPDATNQNNSVIKQSQVSLNRPYSRTANDYRLGLKNLAQKVTNPVKLNSKGSSGTKQFKYHHLDIHSWLREIREFNSDFNKRQQAFTVSKINQEVDGTGKNNSQVQRRGRKRKTILKTPNIESLAATPMHSQSGIDSPKPHSTQKKSLHQGSEQLNIEQLNQKLRFLKITQNGNDENDSNSDDSSEIGTEEEKLNKFNASQQITTQKKQSHVRYYSGSSGSRYQTDSSTKKAFHGNSSDLKGAKVNSENSKKKVHIGNKSSFGGTASFGKNELQSNNHLLSSQEAEEMKPPIMKKQTEEFSTSNGEDVLDLNVEKKSSQKLHKIEEQYSPEPQEERPKKKSPSKLKIMKKNTFGQVNSANNSPGINPQTATKSKFKNGHHDHTPGFRSDTKANKDDTNEQQDEVPLNIGRNGQRVETFGEAAQLALDTERSDLEYQQLDTERALNEDFDDNEKIAFRNAQLPKEEKEALKRYENLEN